MTAGVGILVSLRAPTVRQAQQILSIAVMVVMFGAIYGLGVLPTSWRAALTYALSATAQGRLILGAGALLALLDAGLLLAGLARFRRARLILD